VSKRTTKGPKCEPPRLAGPGRKESHG
jgi:hypothetical protein